MRLYKKLRTALKMPISAGNGPFGKAWQASFSNLKCLVLKMVDLAATNLQSESSDANLKKSVTMHKL